MKKSLSKGGFITAIIVFVVAILIFILLNFVFVVKCVDANLLKESANLSNEQIIEKVNDSKINIKGNSVFFYKRQEMVSQIEKAVPEIKVINLEVQFPNTLRINCEERTPVFALEMTNSALNYAIVDEEFKVISNQYEDTNYLPIHFNIGQNQEEYVFNELQVGDFVITDEITSLTTFCKSLKQYAITESVLLSQFSSLKLYYRSSADSRLLSLVFNSKKGYKIDMRNIMENTDGKINYLLNIIANEDINENQIIE